MKIRTLLLTAAMASTSVAAHGQTRDISEPLQVLGGRVDALSITRLNKTTANDERLAYELVLSTELEIQASMEAIRAMPEEVHKAVLALCSELLFPLMETSNETAGFPKVAGARIMLKGKPAASLGSAAVGQYATLIFPSARGCTFGW